MKNSAARTAVVRERKFADGVFHEVQALKEFAFVDGHFAEAVQGYSAG